MPYSILLLLPLRMNGFVLMRNVDCCVLMVRVCLRVPDYRNSACIHQKYVPCVHGSRSRAC